ncbi:MAG TPA: NAD(P)H-dependent oxidoreductase subunit E, partial [Spirochaetia bacterium]|nr:NAD(P)H-dependent oxidoreductase subunit E [Spirochaetia bacterium]
MVSPEIWSKYPPRKDNILLILHAIQDAHKEDNYIPDEDVAEVAKYLDLPLSEVDGIVTFYKMFSRKPRGRYIIRLCDSLSCRICGSLDMYQYLQMMLGIQNHGTTADRMFSLEIVNCLGCCDTAPNLMI